MVIVANEIYQLSMSGSSTRQISRCYQLHREYNVIIDAYDVAPYIGPTASSQSNPINTATWNAANITQMADLFIHDVWYNPANTTSFVGPTNGSVSGNTLGIHYWLQ